MSGIVLIGIFLALAFDFLNGMNDAANSIATIVSTRVMPPRWAVAWAAFFNFVGAFAIGVPVAKTIGKGIIVPEIVTPQLVLCALVGAIIWTHLCTQWGLPISVSHALIGGLVGAAVVKEGAESLVTSGLVKVAAFIVLSPVIGFGLGIVVMFTVMFLLRNWPKRKAEHLSQRLQLLSAAAFSLGHGLNDAQKTMGIIAMLLFSAVATGQSIPHWIYAGDKFYIPKWVIFACYSVIALGTLMGGWRVIRTMGTKITDLRPTGGFAAAAAGAITVIMATFFGIPVSTTHTITGSIAGVGTVSNMRGVRWGVAGHIMWAWVFTIPVSGAAGALAYYVYHLTIN